MTTNRSSKASQAKFTDQEALQFHAQGKPGKLEITPTKPLATQRDLSLAYSPGVAVPVHAIAQDPSTVYDYTNKGNLVAVVSNGTAILGLGNLGALAAKPVMEGKGALFKRFADIDAIDLLVDTEDPDAFINSVRYLGPSLRRHQSGGHQGPRLLHHRGEAEGAARHPRLPRRPARHRHHRRRGSPQCARADRPRPQELQARRQRRRARPASPASSCWSRWACRKANVMLCDTKGVIYQGRKEGMNQWKSAYAVKTKARTLADALEGPTLCSASRPRAPSRRRWCGRWRRKPIIFAMANPDPEITPEDVAAVRDDAIVATGRSDYPNQINNVLGFPFIFRGALDVQASTINEAMKIAAAKALAELARAEVPDQVAAAFHGRRPTFGPDYIIPAPFDPRLIVNIPTAVAKAAMDSGVARKPIVDMDAYVARLGGRLDPMAGWLQSTFSSVRSDPKRVVFAEGEEPAVIKAAHSYFSQGFGQPILIGTTEIVREQFRDARHGPAARVRGHRYRASRRYLDEFTDFLYARLQRRGYLKRDCQRLVLNERNIFAALMVVHGYADAHRFRRHAQLDDGLRRRYARSWTRSPIAT